MAAPPLTATKAKPEAAKPPPATPKPPPKPKARPGQRRSGFFGFITHQLEMLRGTRPDHTFEGFIVAVKAAIQFVSLKDWNTADDMIEELEHQIRISLRVPDGVFAEFVARDRETKQPRILILTDWGFREAVEGQISFTLHYKPERTPLKPLR